MNKKILYWLDKYFGTGLAIKLSDWLGTVCCIYGVLFLVTIPLRWQTPADLMGWMNWAVQTFFQGIALPILGVSQKIESKKQMALLQETHDISMKSHEELHSKLDLIIDHLEVANGRDNH
jgi:hypothetical protein